jgi:SAM-dependent methyltransferase
MPEQTEVLDYDRLWLEVYGDLQDLGPTHRHMVRLMRRLLAPLQYTSVLDVGVGYGHNLSILTRGRRLERLAGVDVSERALEHVSRHWPGSFQHLDITKGRLAETYDLVCAALVMEHLSEDEAALGNLRAMTSKYLLVTTIAGDFQRYEAWERQVGHVRNYARGELERKLDASGFRLAQIIYWGFPLYSPLARTLQNRMKATSELSVSAKWIASILYPLFFLNSQRRGDLVLALAQPA